MAKQPATVRRAAQRSDRLLEVLRPFAKVAIVTHDNPDPDAIASGWALHRLVSSRLKCSVRLLGGGDIVRAENREMVKLLKPPLELVTSFQADAQTAAVLVDCGAGAANHLLSKAGLAPIAVIDHHETHGCPVRGYCDLRPRMAASASIVGSYLREQKITPDEQLATALMYAIRTETRHAEIRYTRLDRGIFAWLAGLMSPNLLTAIENAPLTRAYFGDLALALQNTVLYGHAAICFLPRAEGAEVIGEVCDLLIRCTEIRMVLCASMIGSDLLLSVRTDKECGNSAALVQYVVAGLGQGGGHYHRAGGKIPAACITSPEALHKQLRTRWLAACEASSARPQRLVALREIVEHL